MSLLTVWDVGTVKAFKAGFQRFDQRRAFLVGSGLMTARCTRFMAACSAGHNPGALTAFLILAFALPYGICGAYHLP
jgi:hypothetical protein